MKCCDYGPWDRVHQMFFLCTLRTGQISQSVCPWQDFPLQNNFCEQGLEQGGQIGRFFSNWATIGSSESSPKNATFSFLFDQSNFNLNNQFQNMVCCSYLQVSKVVNTRTANVLATFKSWVIFPPNFWSPWPRALPRGEYLIGYSVCPQQVFPVQSNVCKLTLEEKCVTLISSGLI